ncbi:23968_t:CDS:1 [Racocetra persica]|uniref:23968_t:CDS:1 n=1 Tax=Racocetra persica TaxID=160502 RepID=A0ACA9RMV2_9GLOM|nr:23968_t:CDS:1 [Racocetra persica]
MSVSAFDRAKSSEYKEEFYADGGKLFCRFCKIVIDHKHKSVIDNHRHSKKHQTYIEIEKTLSSQSQKTRQTTIISHYKLLSESEQINLDFLYLRKKIVTLLK